MTFDATLAAAAEIRRLLEARRRRLHDDLARRVARIREQAANGAVARQPDEDDASELDVSLLEMAASTLRRIDRAIERLDNGRYGWCTRCHNRISEARLRAVPFALCCTECEAAREREDARRAATCALAARDDREGVY